MMYDELVRRLRDAAKISERFAILLPNSEGSATAELYKEAADAIEELQMVRGNWKLLSGDEWVCTVCGHVISTEGSWEHPLETGKLYCENCGADMWEER